MLTSIILTDLSVNTRFSSAGTKVHVTVWAIYMEPYYD